MFGRIGGIHVLPVRRFYERLDIVVDPKQRNAVTGLIRFSRPASREKDSFVI